VHLKPKYCVGSAFIVCGLLGSSELVRTETMDQAMAACIEQFRPTVSNCVRQLATPYRGNPPPGLLEQCKNQVRSQVSACVSSRTGAAGLKNNLLDAATSKPVSPAKSNVTRIAPPRTIADITAILDQEKPDPERIEKAASVCGCIRTCQRRRGY
jgi:hypothetical protein